MTAWDDFYEAMKDFLGISGKCPHGFQDRKQCPKCGSITLDNRSELWPLIQWPPTAPSASDLWWENLEPAIRKAELAGVDPKQFGQGVRRAFTTMEKATAGKRSSKRYYQTMIDHLNTLKPHNDAQQAGIAAVRDTIQALSRERTLEASSGSSGTDGSR